MQKTLLGYAHFSIKYLNVNNRGLNLADLGKLKTVFIYSNFRFDFSQAA
ncbi:MAG: hypothetical protein U5L45_12090 [Saprospiraceae bacterium]|nr:hypothetical protein [Saprospiraceae bacterium]